MRNHIFRSRCVSAQNEQGELYLLNTIFITVLVVSNFLSSKLTVICGLVIPAGTFGYAITFLVTDIVGELFGKDESQKIVWRGFFAIILSFLLAKIAIWLPSMTLDSSYVRIFGSATRVMIASVIGYLISQSLDVIIFHHIKNKTQGRLKWLRNNAGTIFSQIVDTMVFTVIAFYGVVSNIWEMVVDLITAKIILAILDTPFFYLFTQKRKQL
ncbi:MAG: queuosine precursor transporter [Prevotellaceae bacterium]|nr:queuosine precursor transporter [Candidatus Faecinaster equi]